MSKRYNIGCATDKNYAQHLGIMIYSLMTNTASPELFDIYIVDGGILPEDIKRFESISQKFGCKLFFLKPDRKYFDKLKVYEIYSEATYYRYFLIDTTTCEKMLFLDCDMVIEGDVIELYETDQQGNIISAVFEALCPLKHLEKIKLHKSFNAGMFLVNCKKWQEEQISQKAYQYQLENEKLLEYPDQDSLNIILKDSWQMVPYKWNVIARLGLVKYGIGKADYRIIPKVELFDNYNNPKIIHYANRLFKPWYWLDPSPYKSNYIHYKNLSPWKEIPFPDKSFTGVFKRIWYYFSFVFKYIKRNKL
ncbi:MAG: glycosyltransferase family 8 protein [Bacteroidota bacterium]|jgi:lipopolysaccharide biosynthesis glycosyltransferase|nr:glycosyltransferase family 8 protein [Bacteroidota bacterium]MCA6443779.1 glycosyltransferase family 8 protein [Bacteroidota bacterium]